MIGMILGDLQPKRQESYHPLSIDLNKFLRPRGEQEWWRMPEIYEAEMTG